MSVYDTTYMLVQKTHGGAVLPMVNASGQFETFWNLQEAFEAAYTQLDNFHSWYVVDTNEFWGICKKMQFDTYPPAPMFGRLVENETHRD